MSEYHIAWLGGDGIGPEVLTAARLVLDRVGIDFVYHEADIGWECWCREGNTLPLRTLERLSETSCAVFGAAMAKGKDEAEQALDPRLRGKGFAYCNPMVQLRQVRQLTSCIRPCRAFPGNPLNMHEGIDLVVVRELSEGLYTGIEFPRVPAVMQNLPGMDRVPPDARIALKVNSPGGCERIARAAFEYARQHHRKRVTAIHKASILPTTDGLFLHTAQHIASRYPEIQFDHLAVDAACMQLVKGPESFEVIVAPNMYGDIVSDLASQLVGGLGFACTANLGRDYAVFEPSHGAAPKYAGQQRANPIATILATKMMLEWLEERAAARAIENALETVLRRGRVRTRDMGGRATTTDMAEAIAANL